MTNPFLAGGLLVLLSACATASAPAEAPANEKPRAAEAPAVIVHPTAKSRAELAKAVSAALGGPPVTLAADALTHESVLVIEHARPRGPNGLLMEGRDLRQPEQFRLVRIGSACVLVQESTGLRQRLKSVHCVTSHRATAP